MLTELGSSASGSGGASFLRLPYHFLFDVLGGSGPNLNSRTNGIYSASSATMVGGGTNATVSSIMGIVEGVLTLDFVTMLLLDIQMTILCEKSP